MGRGLEAGGPRDGAQAGGHDGVRGAGRGVRGLGRGRDGAQRRAQRGDIGRTGGRAQRCGQLDNCVRARHRIDRRAARDDNGGRFGTGQARHHDFITCVGLHLRQRCRHQAGRGIDPCSGRAGIRIGDRQIGKLNVRLDNGHGYLIERRKPRNGRDPGDHQHENGRR